MSVALYMDRLMKEGLSGTWHPNQGKSISDKKSNTGKDPETAGCHRC